MNRLVLSAVLALAAAPVARAAEPEGITFENQTGARIVHLYEECYGVTDCDWDDLLGDRFLEAGASIRMAVTRPDAVGGCRRDYRAELDGAITVRIENIDSCKPAVLTFRPPAS